MGVERKNIQSKQKSHLKNAQKKVKKNETIFCLCSNFSPLFSTLSKSNIPLSEENLFLKNCINTRVYRKKPKKFFVYYIHTTILLSSTYKFKYRLHYRINNET